MYNVASQTLNFVDVWRSTPSTEFQTCWRQISYEFYIDMKSSFSVTLNYGGSECWAFAVGGISTCGNVSIVHVWGTHTHTHTRTHNVATRHKKRKHCMSQEIRISPATAF